MNETVVQIPKSLPWHARKAGVSIERATALWQDALRLAQGETGQENGPDYWQAANQHFLRLLDDEKNAFYAPKLVPLLRSQHRLMRLPLTAIEDVLSAVAAHCQLRQRRNKFKKAA